MTRHGTLCVLTLLFLVILSLAVPINNLTTISPSNHHAESDMILVQTQGSNLISGSGSNTPTRLEGSEGFHRILYLSNMTTFPSVAERMAELVNPENIRSIVSYLSSFDNRYTGTQGSLQAISYIEGFLRLNCSIQDVFFDNFTFNDEGVLLEASSVIAKISAQNQTDETILVTAHHDSIGYQYPFDVYNADAKGADDDASGVGVLLETARIMSLFKDYLRYNILFIVFAAEEGNKTLDPDFMCQGSTNWISGQHPGVTELGDIVSVVNLDQVAYRKGDSIGIYHYSSGSTIASNISSVTSLLNIPATDEKEPRPNSFLDPIRSRTEDTFDRSQVPEVTLSNYYTDPYIHTSQDTISQLDFNLASNFTRVVTSYIYLTAGMLPKRSETYTHGWSTAIGRGGLFEVDEFNYLSIKFNPGITRSFDLVVLDPSISGINKDDLFETISACATQGKKLPIITLGRANMDILRFLNLTNVECMEQDSSNSDLIAYVGSSITDVGIHPIYNSPNSVVLEPVNSTCMSYTVIDEKPSGNDYYLIRSAEETNPLLLPLAYTPSISELWSWLAVLHDDEWSCGPLAVIGVENGSSITSAAQNIVENMVCWLMNSSRTFTTIRLSDSNPILGDYVRVGVAVRNSLTWVANSSIPISLQVVSPSGRLLLRENCATDEDGVVETSNLLVTEIGEHKLNVTINLGRLGVVRSITLFKSFPRIIIACDGPRISVTQGESTRITLNLTYVPMQSEDLTLGVSGQPLSSNISLVETLKHGYNNMTLAITAKETIQEGEYNLSFTAMPRTMEYVACNQSFAVLVTSAYQVSIIEAPSTMEQYSSAQLIIQIKSYRSIPVQCTLRIDSYGVTLSGEDSIAISPGETKQISVSIKETSLCPYNWGECEIKATIVRSGVAVAKSQPVSIFVSLSAANLVLGYVLPTVLPITIFIEQARRTKARLAAPGTLIGGYTFFAIGLIIYQSLYLIIPLSMLVVGCYVGTTVVEHIYDAPLPRGYDWLIPSLAHDESSSREKRNKQAGKHPQSPPLPQSCSTGISRLKEMYYMGKYGEVVSAAYLMVVDVLSDVLASSTNTMPTRVKDRISLSPEINDGGTLIRLLDQSKRRLISLPQEKALRRLEQLYREYTKILDSGTLNRISQTVVRGIAKESIEIAADITARGPWRDGRQERVRRQ